MNTKSEGRGKGVKSPANSLEGTVANCGGMPPTKTAQQILDSAKAPDERPKNSTEGIETRGKD